MEIVDQARKAGLINQTKSAVSGLVLKYVARASVAIPFVIALAFAVAAIAAMLVQHLGHVAGYWIMAGGLVGVGIIAAIVVGVKEHEDKVAEHKAAQADTQAVVSDATAAAMTQAPLAVVCVAMRCHHRPQGARIMGRNFPLVLLFVMIGTLLWPTEATAGQDRLDQSSQRPTLS